MFSFSKLIEFGDTIFLVMKKKRIIFLHWYHHVTVYILVFHVWSTFNPICRYFAMINYVVHTIMYAYYAITSTGICVPRIISIFITSLQLSQMFIGLIVCVLYYLNCDTSDNSSTYLALIIYGSYSGLFAHFLIKTYFSIGANKSKRSVYNTLNGKAITIDGFKDE